MTAAIGTQATVSDVETGSESSFSIVAPGQSNPSKGHLSSDSPIARALGGAAPGDVVTVTLPRGKRQLLNLTIV
jgi:transcription elongation GreA/GreB family factor